MEADHSWQEFLNEPDTDFSLPANRAWLRAALEPYARLSGQEVASCVGGERAAKPGQLVDEGLAIETVVFPNGARVHCRTMDFRKDSVTVMLRFVGGGLDEGGAGGAGGTGGAAAWAMAQSASSSSRR